MARDTHELRDDECFKRISDKEWQEIKEFAYQLQAGINKLKDKEMESRNEKSIRPEYIKLDRQSVKGPS